MRAENNVLILFCELDSSLTNLNYWREKIAQQLFAENSFSLVAVLNSKRPVTVGREKLRSQAEAWFKELTPNLEKYCHGYAIVVEPGIAHRYTDQYLKKIEVILGCPCRVFSDLEEAMSWSQIRGPKLMGPELLSS